MKQNGQNPFISKYIKDTSSHLFNTVLRFNDVLLCTYLNKFNYAMSDKMLKLRVGLWILVCFFCDLVDFF
jgi:hypothetical protein